MAYEVVEIVEWINSTKQQRMNDGKTFEKREHADGFMLSILMSPKLGIKDYCWEEDQDFDAADIAAFTASHIRQFAIQNVVE